MKWRLLISLVASKQVAGQRKTQLVKNNAFFSWKYHLENDREVTLELMADSTSYSYHDTHDNNDIMISASLYPSHCLPSWQCFSVLKCVEKQKQTWSTACSDLVSCIDICYHFCEIACVKILVIQVWFEVCPSISYFWFSIILATHWWCFKSYLLWYILIQQTKSHLRIYQMPVESVQHI